MSILWPQTAVLHDHLDGSRALIPVLPQLFGLSRKKFPFDLKGDLYSQGAEIFKEPQIDIEQKFSNTTGVMQDQLTISIAAGNYVRVRARQGFKYCEATIAPQYHVFGGLTVPEVLDAFIEGIKEGEEQFPFMETNLIASVGREASSEEAVRLVEQFAECDRNYMVGIGLVCNEHAHPPEKHLAMFKRAKELKFKTTCHAGEWIHHPATGYANWEKDKYWLLRNVRTAVYELEVDRLDHAIPLAYDPNLIEAVKERGVSVTSCPGNYLGNRLIPNAKYLKIRELLKADVVYSLGPDDDLFMPELEEVFEMCDAEYDFTKEEKQKLLRNPWLARFGSRKEHKF